MRVSRLSLTRALILLNVLIRELEDLGYSVQVSNAGHTMVAMDGVEMSLEFRERAQREENAPPDKGTPSWTYQKFSFHPSGELEIVLSRWPIGERRWRDRPKTQLEEQIPDILAEIVRSTDLVRQENARRAADEQRRLLVLREQEARRILEQEEKQRLEDLEEQARSWRRAADLRDYIAAVITALPQISPAPDASAIDRWMSWASSHADRLDPIVSGNVKRQVIRSTT